MNNDSELKKKISESRRLYQNPYAHLNGIGEYDSVLKRNASASQKNTHLPSLYELQNPYASLSGEGNHSTETETVLHINNPRPQKSKSVVVEQAAHDLRVKIWKKRHELWPDGVPSDHVELLDPAKAIELIGYKLDEQEHLGNFADEGEATGVAGVIDRVGKRISISTHFPSHIQRFTAAHEIGHALMHNDAVIHRDRPVDGARKQRAPMEIEADKFAASFLMPEKLVRDRFRNVFGSDFFVLNDDTAFALDPGKPNELLSKCKARHVLARTLAGTMNYSGVHVRSLAEQFKVSISAMAIRIEELKLF